jgi:hypothetical protein
MHCFLLGVGAGAFIEKSTYWFHEKNLMYSGELKTTKVTPYLIRVLLLAALVFLILYNISLKGVPLITSGRLAVIVLLVWVVFILKKNPLKNFDTKYLLLFFPVPFVVVLFLLVGDPGQLSRFFHLALYSFLGAILTTQVARSPKEAMFAILIAITFQSILVPFAFFNQFFREWYSIYIESGANFDSTYMYRTNGLSSQSGAALSVIQSLGVLAGAVIFRLSNNDEKLSFLGKISILASMLLCGVSTIFIGRTGLVLSLIFFSFLIFSNAYMNGLKSKVFLFSSILIILLFLYLLFFESFVAFFPENFSFEYYLNWIFGFFVGQDETLSFLASTPIPALGVDTFLGTGLVSLINGSNPSGHDSGFVQTYYAMGLFVSFVFYVCYFYMLYYLTFWLPFIARMILVLVFFSLEVKEPFLFKYALMFFLMVAYHSHKIFIVKDKRTYISAAH